MPTITPLHARIGAGSPGGARRGGVAPAAFADQAEIARIAAARDRVAMLLAEGEEWALPLFTRLEAELALLSDQQDTLARARVIAEAAAQRRRAA